MARMNWDKVRRDSRMAKYGKEPLHATEDLLLDASYASKIASARQKPSVAHSQTSAVIKPVQKKQSFKLVQCPCCESLVPPHNHQKHTKKVNGAKTITTEARHFPVPKTTVEPQTHSILARSRANTVRQLTSKIQQLLLGDSLDSPMAIGVVSILTSLIRARQTVLRELFLSDQEEFKRLVAHLRAARRPGGLP